MTVYQFLSLSFFFLNNEYGERIRIVHYSRYELLKIYLLALLLV